MIRKKVPVKTHVLMFDRGMVGTRGRSRVISTSKIRKITAIRKNRKENGMRADPFGSNPHSNGEFFSRSLIVFFEIIEEIVIKAIEIIKIVKMNKDRDRIVIPGLMPALLIGSQLY